MFYDVIYPSVERQWPSPSSPEQLFNRNFISLESDSISRTIVADRIFGGWQGTGLGNEFPAFLKLGCRSMSVGDVIHFENSNQWHICDSCGWLTVSLNEVRSWLIFPRKYGCYMIELNDWKATLAKA